MAQKAYEHTVTLTNQARDCGVDVETSDDIIDKRLTFLEKANGNYSVAMYNYAFEWARRAQERFRTAIGALDETDLEEEDDEVGKVY